MLDKQYLVFCNLCSFKSIVIESQFSQFTEIAQCNIQKNLDKLEDSKLVPCKHIKRMRKFKCPKCGKGMFTPTPIKEEVKDDKN